MSPRNGIFALSAAVLIAAAAPALAHHDAPFPPRGYGRVIVNEPPPVYRHAPVHRAPVHPDWRRGPVQVHEPVPVYGPPVAAPVYGTVYEPGRRHRDNGAAAIGAIGGAVLGAVIADQSGMHPLPGIAAGAVIGGILGSAIGRH